MIYTSTIASGSLRLRETRIVAGLLLQEVSGDDWSQAIREDNIFQLGLPSSNWQLANLIRRRLVGFGPELWEMIRDGDPSLASQAAMAGAIRDSRLLGDFMDLVIREQRATFATHLSPLLWNDFVQSCRMRDPQMPEWGEATVRRLRSAVFRILEEGGFIEDTRRLRLQGVFIDASLSDYLRQVDAKYVLRCLEVME